jgi:MGT family glycosyltransferase
LKGVFLSLPLHGHVNPTLPLVRELTSKGDEIIYYTNDSFASSVTQAGGRFRRYAHPPLSSPERLFVEVEAISSRIVDATAHVLETDLERFRAERPDYVIADSLAPWGHWAGLIIGVPVITSVSTFAMNRHVMRFSAARGVRPKSLSGSLSKLRHLTTAFGATRRLRRRYGVRGPGPVRSVLGRSDLNIVYTSRYFQPCAETFDDQYQFVGPSVAARTDGGSGWATQIEGPAVYISLGTVFNQNRQFYQRCVETFGGRDLQVIMSTGSAVAPESLGTAPSNFIVRARVPQLEVLRRVSVFITHGGMNSVSEALHYGVPVLVVPQTGEQALVGRRTEQLGAGLYLANDETGAGNLRSSVDRLLLDDRFKQAASEIRKSFDASGGAPRAADAITSFIKAPLR